MDFLFAIDWAFLVLLKSARYSLFYIFEE